MRAVRVRSRHFNGRQPSGLKIFRQRDESSSGRWGTYARDKTQQDFALKMQGGLMREGGGGIFAGHYGNTLSKNGSKSRCYNYVPLVQF